MDKQKHDLIRKKYYSPVETAEKYSDGLFYLAILLSFSAIFVEKSKHPKMYGVVHLLFIIVVIVFFTIGQALRLYLVPRAEDKRRQDFLSNAYGVPLSYDLTEGYYNSNLSNSVERIAAQVLENAFFSKSIVIEMVKTTRIYTASYLILWFIVALWRSTDLAILAVIAQTVFSEQLVSRWLRLEWLRSRFEKIYDDLYILFQSKSKNNTFDARVLESFGKYETTKANGGITLSSKIFDRLNLNLSQEWEKIKGVLGIAETR
jgi:hypothetical protein